MREESSRRNVYGDLNINHKGRKDREAAIRLVMHQMLAKNRIDRRRRMSACLDNPFLWFLIVIFGLIAILAILEKRNER